MTWVLFRPLDAITIRDGRPFDAGSGAAADTLSFPNPYTFAGACTAAFGGHPRWVTGPFLYANQSAWWHVPLDVVKEEGGDAHRLTLTRVAEGAATDLRLEWLPEGDGDALPGWLSTHELSSYLAEPAYAPKSNTSVGPLTETRVGLRRQDGVAAESYLYSNRYLRLPSDFQQTGFTGWVEGVSDLQHDLVPFGGESRFASVEIIDWDVLPRMPTLDTRVLVYIATPAVFADGWQFPASDQGYRAVSAPKVVSAVVGRSHPITGWRRGGPRWVRWSVPSGSVYYLEFGSADEANEWARRQHGRALTQDMKKRRTAGHGVCLIGKW